MGCPVNWINILLGTLFLAPCVYVLFIRVDQFDEYARRSRICQHVKLDSSSGPRKKTP